MKTFAKTIVIIFALLIGKRAFSQSFNGGILLGAVASQVDGDLYAGYHQFGPTAGFYANWPLTQDLLFQMELKYSLFGAHSDIKEVENGMNDFDLKLHYAEIPLMLRYHFGAFDVNGTSLDFVSVEAGASLDFLLKNTQSANYEPEYQSHRWRFFSMTANAGLHFDLNEHWGIGVRGMYSFLPIRVKGNVPSWFYGHYYNKAIQFVGTYNIRASKSR